LHEPGHTCAAIGTGIYGGRVASPDKLIVLDTPSLYFRAFYGVPESVTAPDGIPVNAVRGLLDFIARLVRDRQPTRLVAAMDDDWRPAWRVAALPSYKAHRVSKDGGDQTPDSLAVQVPVIEEVLAALGLCRMGLAGYEADDVIGTLATTADCPVDVVTGDRDLFQLVDDDKPVRIVYTAKGVGQASAWDEAAVTAKYGIPGRGYGEYAVLRGDPSDGLPGVPGVGDKTAAALVSRFGTVDEIVAAARSGTDDGFPAGARAKVLAAQDYLAKAPAVVRVVCDLELPERDDRLRHSPKDPEALLALSDRWGLDSALNRLLAAIAQATPE
jgi:5'-3' exonuclease